MWLTDPELFLYSKVGGYDVQVWRCKQTMMNASSQLVVPMVPDDFEYVSQVKDHSDLVDGNILDWEETDYKALVKYISERRLLVNAQGLVIVEISKFSEEGEDAQTDADILPIYLRSVDIPSLKAYIPKLKERPTTNTTKQVAELQDELKRERSEKLALAKRVAGAEVKIKTLEAKNVNLDRNNIKLKQDLANEEAENKTLEANLAALKDKVADLESKKRTLEENITKLTENQVVWKQKFTDLESKSSKTTRDQEERITKLNAEVVILKNKVKDLESKNKTQENRITTLNADLSSKTTQLATAQRDLTRANNRESWMNDITPKSHWVGYQELRSIPWARNVTPLAGPTEYTVNDGHNNVRATYWAQVRVNENRKPFKAIAIDKYLVPNGRSKAKFDGDFCWTVRCNFGVSYVLSYE